MDHFFITTAEVISRRWRDAFATAKIIDCKKGETFLTPPVLAWVLLDGEDALALLMECLQQGNKVVAMTRNENAAQAKRLIGAGASGYIHYLATPELLQQVAQVVEMDGIWLGAELMRQLMMFTASKQAVLSDAKLGVLTPREREVAEAVAAGKTNKEVARVLKITERTVKAHLGAIFEKLEVRDRLQLVLSLGKSA